MLVPGISVRGEEREAVILGKSARRSWNDPSRERCNRAGQLRLEAGLQAGFGLSKVACQRQGACGMTMLSLIVVRSTALG